MVDYLFIHHNSFASSFCQHRSVLAVLVYRCRCCCCADDCRRAISCKLHAFGRSRSQSHPPNPPVSGALNFETASFDIRPYRLNSIFHFVISSSAYRFLRGHCR